MFKLVKKVYLNALVLWHYRTLYPTYVRLPRSTQLVAINPHDRRARKKLMADGLRNKNFRRDQFWRAACNELRPSVALDIGTNYGECLFSVSYESGTRAVGVDANPQLRIFLEKSRQLHPTSGQIQIHTALVDECSDGHGSFYIHNSWSGGSTASKQWRDRNAAAFQEVDVPRLTVDELVGDIDGDRPVVFKIDIEGYEAHAFRGMRKLLAKGVDMVGFIEFSLEMLRAAGNDPEEFWGFLQENFQCYFFVDKNHCQHCSGKTLSDLRLLLERRKGHTDLLLIRSRQQDKYNHFVSHWTQRAAA